MDFKNNIKEVRQKVGISRSELAEKLNIKTRTLESYEQCRRTPKIEVLNKICEILEVPITEIVSRGDYLGFKEQADIEMLMSLVNYKADFGKNFFSSFRELVRLIDNKLFNTLDHESALMFKHALEDVFNGLIKLSEIDRYKNLELIDSADKQLESIRTTQIKDLKEDFKILLNIAENWGRYDD